MGAWGYGIYENDYAMDTSHFIREKPLPELINYCLNDGDEYDARMGADIFLRTQELLSFIADYTLEEWVEETAAKYVVRLESILTDKDWIDSWVDSTFVERDIKNQISRLKSLV